MKYDDIFGKEYMSKISEMQKLASSVINTELQDALKMAAIPEVQQDYIITSEMAKILAPFQSVIRQCQKEYYSFTDIIQPIKPLYPYEEIRDHIQQLYILKDYKLLHCHPDNMTKENVEENEKVNNKIVEEIFRPEDDKLPNKNTIITLSPINDKVLKYLSENPSALYHLDDREFEIVMAEIYNKLGYEVELTQSTRDGGKDIIIRKPEILGDFIYYVECKHNAPKRHIGVGIIRNLIGTINTDRVNGGILATTSFFTKDAKEYILKNNLSAQVKLHDYEVIRNLLDRVA